MKKEDFIPLIEIQSIEKSLSLLEKSLEAELKRLDDLKRLNQNNEEKLKLTQQDIQCFESEIKDNEVRLQEMDQQIKKCDSDIMSSTTNQEVISLEKKVSDLKDQVSNIEDITFDLMEKIEVSKIEENKLLTFKENFPSTYDEIKSEILIENKSVVSNIESKKQRLQELSSETNTHLLKVYQGAKKRINDPIAFLENRQCGRCKTALDNFSIAAIESYREVISCTSCKRILVSKDIMY